MDGVRAGSPWLAPPLADVGSELQCNVRRHHHDILRVGNELCQRRALHGLGSLLRGLGQRLLQDVLDDVRLERPLAALDEPASSQQRS